MVKKMTKFGIAAGVAAVVGGVAMLSVCYGQTGPMRQGMHHGGGMMDRSGLRHGRWHHVRMHGLSKDTSKMSFETRGRYIFETACTDCHGPGGRGGVKNPNYEQGTVPALDELADSMGLFRKEHAETVLGLLEKGVDPSTKRSDPPFRGYARFVAQYDSVRDTIENGREAAKEDPEGPEPEDMPAWGRTLNDRDIDAVIGHVIRLYDFPETTDGPDGGGSFP